MYFDNNTLDRFQQTLTSACTKMGLSLSQNQIDSLLAYLGLLAKWNKAFNLTAVRQPEDMLSRHIIDSLSIVPYISGQRILDVGTGPGLPGIPLAIIFPEIDFTLLDSNSKKTRFLTQSVIELGLNNITVCQARVENIDFDQPFQQIMSRAFSSLANMVSLCDQHLAADGQYLAMKGLEPEEEKQQLSDLYKIEKTIKLKVPGCEAQRHLIIINRTEPIT